MLQKKTRVDMFPRTSKPLTCSRILRKANGKRNYERCNFYETKGALMWLSQITVKRNKIEVFKCLLLRNTLPEGKKKIS